MTENPTPPLSDSIVQSETPEHRRIIVLTDEAKKQIRELMARTLGQPKRRAPKPVEETHYEDWQPSEILRVESTFASIALQIMRDSYAKKNFPTRDLLLTELNSHKAIDALQLDTADRIQIINHIVSRLYGDFRGPKQEVIRSILQTFVSLDYRTIVAATSAFVMNTAKDVIRDIVKDAPLTPADEDTIERFVDNFLTTIQAPYCAVFAQHTRENSMIRPEDFSHFWLSQGICFLYDDARRLFDRYELSDRKQYESWEVVMASPECKPPNEFGLMTPDRKVGIIMALRRISQQLIGNHPLDISRLDADLKNLAEATDLPYDILFKLFLMEFLDMKPPVDTESS